MKQPLVLTTPLGGADVPAPSDPVPTPPRETPPDIPQETPPTEAPDLPPAPPTEAPDDLPGRDIPDDTPARPDVPQELPPSPDPDLPPDNRPDEAPVPHDPDPAPTPQDVPTNPADLHLRRANPLDAGRLGDIITQATLAATWKPRLHSSVEDIAHAGRMIDAGWVTVAELDHRTAGFIARDADYIHSLYVADFAQGRGVGQALLQSAKDACDRLELWALQDNRGARRFYRREGFQETEQTDGTHNDEGLPDVRCVWTRPPAAPQLTLPQTSAVQRP